MTDGLSKIRMHILKGDFKMAPGCLFRVLVDILTDFPEYGTDLCLIFHKGFELSDALGNPDFELIVTL